MKLSTATIYGMIWLLPSRMVGQIDLLRISGIKIDGQPEAEITFRNKMLEKVRIEEAILSLEMAGLRQLIVEEQAKKMGEAEPKMNDVDDLIIQRLRSKEKLLDQKLAQNRSYVELLEQTLSWTGLERDVVLDETLREKKNKEGESEKQINIEAYRPKDTRINKAYFPEMDLMNHPPKDDCRLNSILNNIEKDYWGHTTPQLLFSHTDQKLELYFPIRDFIVGHGSLSMANGGVKALDLVISIASPKANYIFGAIKQGDFIVIKLLKGTEVRLQSLALSKGEWDIPTRSFNYRCRYLIGIREERLLKKEEVDKIIIRWGKVQEEFEIFDLDFFINHFDCLENG